MRYVLGLDVGIASIGWAVLELDDQDAVTQLIDGGVHLFDRPENPKDGTPYAAIRRGFRSQRRRIRRRAYRLKKIRALFRQAGLPNVENVLANPHLDPWLLRLEGIDRLLSPEELAKALYHIAAHRGFQSNRKTETKDKETGKILSGIQDNLALMHEKGYRTVAEMVLKDEKFSSRKRNKEGDYSHTIPRELLLDEINLLLTNQKRLGHPWLTQPLSDPFPLPDNQGETTDFWQAYTQWFAAQRPFDNFDKLIGKCEFFKEEDRAPKASYTFERFRLWQALNHLRLLTPDGERALTDGEKRAIEQLAHMIQKVKYARIRKELGLPEEIRFKQVRVTKKAKNYLEAEKQADFISLPAYHQMKKALGADFERLMRSCPDLLDHLAECFTRNKTDQNIRKALTSQLGNCLAPELREQLLGQLDFSGFAHLSQRALKVLQPYLERGLSYMEAVMQAQADGQLPDNVRHSTRSKKLPPLLQHPDAPRNFTVVRSLTQLRKLINAVINQYGSPTRIHVELARDLSRPFSERKQLENRQKENQKEKERILNLLAELYPARSGRFSGTDILKYRLGEEQNWRCPYSGEPIEPERLLEAGAYEIDHILPFSRSWDDSYLNKVLVLTRENRNKGNQTPYEYFTSTGQWDTFSIRLQGLFKQLPTGKLERLLRKNFDESAAMEFRDRNLNDTRYIGRFLAQWLNDSLIFADDSVKQPVRTVKGPITALLRYHWGLHKNREESDRHHFLDAAVIACATPGMIQKISNWSRKKELQWIEGKLEHIDRDTGELFRFPSPFADFREQVMALFQRPDDFSRVLVSRLPRRKIQGQLLEATLYSPKYLDERKLAVRRPLSQITKESELDGLPDKDGRNAKLYAALCERIRREHQKGNKHPFSQPFFIGPQGVEVSPDHPEAREIKKIRLIQTGSGIPIHDQTAVASRGDMWRVDVFSRLNKKGKKKFYLVPIYRIDAARGILPNRAIAAHKPEDEWTEMTEDYQFEFSLYPGDLIYARKKDAEYFGYYKGTHRGTGSISITPLNPASKDNFGAQNMDEISKLMVDILGRVYPVVQERRHGIPGCTCQPAGTTEAQPEPHSDHSERR